MTHEIETVVIVHKDSKKNVTAFAVASVVKIP